jgi:hypothetical protein
MPGHCEWLLQSHYKFYLAVALKHIYVCGARPEDVAY